MGFSFIKAGKHVCSATITALFTRQVPTLTRYLEHKSGDRCLAEDLVQESLLRLVVQLRQGLVDNVDGYLHRTACNLLVDHLRQRTRQRTESCEHGVLEQFVDPTPGPHLLAAGAQRDALLAKIIDQLPARTGEVLRLKRLEGFSHIAVAQQLNISPSCVQKHLVKALWLIPRYLRKAGLATDCL